MRKQSVMGRESRNFLIIKRSASLAETASTLLENPKNDWILVEWQDGKKKHYSIFKHRFFVKRFMTPNLFDPKNPELEYKEGDRRYHLLLDRTLMKSPVTSSFSDKVPRLQLTEKDMRTAVGRAVSQHAITFGVPEEKPKWTAKNLTTALEATLARVVISKGTVQPIAVLHPVRPSFRGTRQSSGIYKIVIPNFSILNSRAEIAEPDLKLRAARQDSASIILEDDDQTLATLNFGNGGRFSHMVFDNKAVKALTQGDVKLDQGDVKVSVSATGDMHLQVPLDTSGFKDAGEVSDKFGDWQLIGPKVAGHPSRIAGRNNPHASIIVPADLLATAELKAEPDGPVNPLPVTRPPDVPQELFPEIFCDPSHVIQKKKFTAIIRVLREKPLDKETTGNFTLPSGPIDELYTVNVHLLMRGESKWGELQCSFAAGTIKEALFDLEAPEMPVDERGNLMEHTFELIRVNFYLNGRWCGEAQKNIEILRGEDIRPADRIPLAGVPLWRRYLQAEPDAEPPDLLVRIQSEGGDSYRWTFASPHVVFALANEDCVHTLANPERFVQDNFEWLAGRDSVDVNRDNIEGSCESLYRNTPKGFKDAYWQLFRAVKEQNDHPAESSKKAIKFKTIQFVSDEPCVPWEIMRVVDREMEPDVGPVILSAEYQVGRWLAESSFILRSHIEVLNFAVSTSTYSGIQGVSPLPWTADEKAYLIKEPWNATPLNLLLADIRKFLTDGRAQAIHFACHGDMDQAVPARSKILLEDELNNFRTTAVDKDEVRMGIGRYHPLIFLNACQLGAEGKVLSLGSGWPQTFLDIGASAFIGPLWSVQDESARDAATLFYGELEAGKSLGEALQAMRKKWVAGGSVTFLAYALYGDPTAKVARISNASNTDNLSQG